MSNKTAIGYANNGNNSSQNSCWGKKLISEHSCLYLKVAKGELLKKAL
jgi:hypothetical protein